jgi:proteasome lid subunit RPN8/RPN11
VRLAPELLDRIVEHARRDAPNECCGLVGVRDGAAFDVVETANAEASPLRFNIEGRDLFQALQRIEDAGGDLGAVYHSHTRSDPYPSQTDVTFAANWPGVEWIIVGLARGEEPQVRSYLIEGGAVTEVAIEP